MNADALDLVPLRDGGVHLRVHVRPRSRGGRTGVHSVQDGALLVRVAAAPVDGAANAELVATLAESLGVPKRDVLLVQGARARAKVVEVRGLSVQQARERLGAVVGRADS